MPIFGEKPFTSITVKINQLCRPHRNDDLEDDSIEIYVTDLIELIKLQLLGATEAARAVRKKIKYGNTVDEQLLALSLLELLVLNAGQKIGHVIASDDKLLDLLKSIVQGHARSGLGTDYDRAVITKVKNLAIGWKSEFADLDGYKGMASLWKSIPRKKAHARLTSASRFEDEPFGSADSFRSPTPDRRPVREPESDDDEILSGYSRSRSDSNRRAPPRPSVASPYAMKEDDAKKKRKKKKSKGKRYADEQFKIPQINYKVEAPKIRNTIANCYTHTTALNNYLLALPAGSDPLNDDKVAKEFEMCRKIRRSVLRYLQFVGAGDPSEKSAEVVAMDEEFLGSLIVANEQLVLTFQQFDKASGYTAENPAPAYNDDDLDDESDESYYLSDSDVDLVSQRVDDLSVQETSSRLQETVRSPPPRPQKSADLRNRVAHAREERPPAISKTQSYASVESGDPFGDSNEVSNVKSRYV